MTTQEKDCWLIEQSGDMRQVWGPYTISQARREAGVRHVIVVGSGLSHGDTMRRSELHAAVQSGRIRPVDGSDPRCIA